MRAYGILELKRRLESRLEKARLVPKVIRQLEGVADTLRVLSALEEAGVKRVLMRSAYERGPYKLAPHPYPRAK